MCIHIRYLPSKFSWNELPLPNYCILHSLPFCNYIFTRWHFPVCALMWTHMHFLMAEAALSDRIYAKVPPKDTWGWITQWASWICSICKIYLGFSSSPGVTCPAHIFTLVQQIIFHILWNFMACKRVCLNMELRFDLFIDLGRKPLQALRSAVLKAGSHWPVFLDTILDISKVTCRELRVVLWSLHILQRMSANSLVLIGPTKHLWRKCQGSHGSSAMPQAVTALWD